MSIIEINAVQNYMVEIVPGLLSRLGERAAQVIGGRTAFIITDDVVEKLYLHQAVISLENAGFTVFSQAFPHGERAKNGQTYLSLLEMLAQSRLTRSDVVIALGGGVVGDLAGFTAATYLRGIPYIQIPTTLLAMVDSSVGGKTAINLPAGKNLAGAFYQPRYVLCDPEVLSTLPEEVFRDGCAEVIKYAILGSPDLFERLLSCPVAEQLQDVIEVCVSMKQHYVSRDEFDRGERQYLNLGHTLGHAVEAASNFSLSHGQSVAIGTAMIARAAAAMGFCSQETSTRIQALLERYGLPLKTDLPTEVLLQAALGDKKRQGDHLTLVIPQSIGQCRLQKITTHELRQWIEMGR